MATSNKMRALNGLPFDFEDGIKVAGVDLSDSSFSVRIGHDGGTIKDVLE